MKNLPLLDLKREYKFLERDIQRQIQGCLKSQQWILGKKVDLFEKAAAEYLGAKHAVGVASGTDALTLSLCALALKTKGKVCFDKKDEIITTPFTFIATAESILRSGAKPVFVDIDLNTYNIDPQAVQAAVSKNTVGILPVHLYGLACQMDKIMKIAKANNLFVVEDAAQSFGAGFKNKKLGTIGDCGAFSFFPSKNLGAYGDGGLVVTDNSRLAESLKVIRVHGQTSRYKSDFLGFNSRLDAFQAAILSAKLKYIDKFNSLRKQVAASYNEYFDSIEGIQIPYEPKSSHHVYYLYSLKVPSKRDQLIGYLMQNSIHSRAYYPYSLDQMKTFRQAKVKPLKNVREVTSKIISLPAHPFLKKSEIRFIADKVRGFFSK